MRTRVLTPARSLDQSALVEVSWKAEAKVRLKLSCRGWDSGPTSGQEQDLARARGAAMTPRTGWTELGPLLQRRLTAENCQHLAESCQHMT